MGVTTSGVEVIHLRRRRRRQQRRRRRAGSALHFHVYTTMALGAELSRGGSNVPEFHTSTDCAYRQKYCHFPHQNPSDYDPLRGSIVRPSGRPPVTRGSLHPPPTGHHFQGFVCVAVAIDTNRMHPGANLGEQDPPLWAPPLINGSVGMSTMEPADVGQAGRGRGAGRH